MDELDLRILRELFYKPHDPSDTRNRPSNPWLIAKRLGVSGNTVKRRIEQMRKAGVIESIQIVPSINILGVDVSHYFFVIPDIQNKRQIIEKIKLLEFVEQIFNYVGGTFSLSIVHENDEQLNRRFDLIRKIAEPIEVIQFYRREHKPLALELSKLDWQIIKHLRHDAWQQFSRIASGLKVSHRTVRNRFTRLFLSRALNVWPIINPARIRNMITFALVFFLSPERRSQARMKILASFDNYFYRSTPEIENVWLFLMRNSMAEIEDDLLKARRVDGVKEVKLFLTREWYWSFGWIDDMIARKAG